MKKGFNMTMDEALQLVKSGEYGVATRKEWAFPAFHRHPFRQCVCWDKSQGKFINWRIDGQHVDFNPTRSDREDHDWDVAMPKYYSTE